MTGPRPVPSPDELALAKRNVERMLARGASAQEILAYADSVGVPRKASYREPPDAPKVNFLNSVGLRAFNGITLGFGREGLAKLRSLVQREPIEQSRAWLAQQEATGAIGGLAEMAGSMVPAMATGGASAALRGVAPSLLRKIGATAVEGAAFGGVSAMGHAAPGERLASAPAGMVSGTVAGVGVGALGAGLKPGAAVATSWLRRLMAPGTVAKSAADQADHIVVQALARDKMTVDQAIVKATEMAKQGAPVTLTDVLGENGHAVAQAVHALPGPAKQELTDLYVHRQSGQGERLLDLAVRTGKSGLQNVYQLKTNLVAQRAAEAAPLYEAAYEQKVVLTKEMKKLLDHPTMRRIYELGRAIARTDPEFRGIAPTPLYKTEAQPAGLEGIFGKPQVKVADEVSVSGLDYMKRGLQKMVEAGRTGKASIDHTAARNLHARLRALLDLVDEAVPDYADARASFAGHSEVLDAMELGRSFLKTPPDLIQQTLKGMGKSEREFYTVGAMEDLRDAVYGLKAQAPDYTTAVFGGKDMALRMQHLLGDQAPEFLDGLRTEAQLSRAVRLFGGSRTANLGRQMQDLEGPGLAVGVGLVTGGPRAAATSALGHVVARAKTGWTDEVSQALGEAFMRGQHGPGELIAYLHTLKPVGFRQVSRGVAGKVAAAAINQ